MSNDPLDREVDLSGAEEGAVAPDGGKTRITINLDSDVVNAAKRRAGELGMGYQTYLNRLLREALFGKALDRSAEDLEVLVERAVRKGMAQAKD